MVWRALGSSVALCVTRNMDPACHPTHPHEAMRGTHAWALAFQQHTMEMAGALRRAPRHALLQEAGLVRVCAAPILVFAQRRDAAGGG